MLSCKPPQHDTELQSYSHPAQSVASCNDAAAKCTHLLDALRRMMEPRTSTDDLEAQGNSIDEKIDQRLNDARKHSTDADAATQPCPRSQGPASSRRTSPNATTGRHSTGSAAANASRNSSSDDSDESNLGEDEEMYVFDFAEALRSEMPPGEPWFMEMTRLRRLYFLHLNRELAKMRKKILEGRRASKADMNELRDLLRDQADAIRDFQYIKSLDYLSSGQMEKRRSQCNAFFTHTARSADPTVAPFETENYRTLPRVPQTALQPFSDEVREFMRLYLPSKMTWTKAEMEAKPDLYANHYAPSTLSPNVDRFARFTIAMAGALFILVPMYVMAIDQSRTKNLVTTTVAVLLFALLCSMTLRTSNDQTLGATAGYAAVLMVFVGLTSSSERRQN